MPTTLKDRVQHAAVTTFARLGLKVLLLGAPDGYLRRTGWVNSARARRPVDADGQSQPWLTMPAIAFLGGRLRDDMTLLEYGSGGSTAWYARHVGCVVSVEHDRHWFDQIQAGLPPNVDLRYCAAEQPGEFLQLVFRPLGDPLPYARVVDTFDAAAFPDVVVIDGVDRLNCVALVAERAPSSTVIVVDNLEYAAELHPAIKLLTSRGYRQLDFWGVAPGELRLSDTAVFYRGDNCLGI